MRTLVAWTAIAMVSCTARADPAPAPPDWSSDRFLVGRWSCELTRPGKPLAHERAAYSLGLSDRWLKLTYTKTSDDRAAPAVTTDAYESFDPGLGKWVYLSISSDGSYGTAYSNGWAAGAKTYAPSPDLKGPWRLLVTKLSDREFVEDIEVVSADGSWSRVSRLQCRRER